MPKFLDDRPVITEGRSPIDASGVLVARDLFKFQEDRFGKAVQELATQLQDRLDWEAGAEINIDDELVRLRRLDEIIE